MNLFCDNKVAIAIAQNPIQHDCTKHVEVDHHFIKENLNGRIIQFPFIQSKSQLANVLTKIVSGKAFHDIFDKLGMINIVGTCAAARRSSTLKEISECLFLANRERQGILVSYQ